MIERAHWIGPMRWGGEEVLCFRRRFVLETVPREFSIEVTADQRYRLYVNGQFVGFGPQRGDPLHWFFDRYDLHEMLWVGENELQAIVWWLDRPPMAQMTVRPGFVLAGDGIETPHDWEVTSDFGPNFAFMFRQSPSYYIDVGPGEFWNHQPELGQGLPEEAEWEVPNVIAPAELRGQAKGGTPWNLLPRSIPPMQYRLHFGEPLVVDQATDARRPLTFPLDLREGVRLDFRELLCAFPRFQFATSDLVTATYQEAPVDPATRAKGHRDETLGKVLDGYLDEFHAVEGKWVEPLWWRTFRYVELQGNNQLVNLEVMKTGYPYRLDSAFAAEGTRELWEVAIRTAERCAGETYFDCPYYEQLQYIGDTRIQALIHYYLSRDRALARNAVETLAWSVLPEGILQSRYPSQQPQVIPPFALWWILMTYDQWLFDDVDPERYAPIRSGILRWWEERSADEPWWQFADWVPRWGWGVPPGGSQSVIHRLTLDLARVAHGKMADRDVNSPRAMELARELLLGYRLRAPHPLAPFPQSGEGGIFGAPQPLLVEDSDGDGRPSEHAESLYRLLQREAGLPVSPWPTGALDASNADRCTYYFQFYRHLAECPADYLACLKPWSAMLDQGLTTFAENPEPTRSDCHAWSAHPAYGLFRHVAGIESIAPGWSRARIAPRPGSLNRFEANLAHPSGDLRLLYLDGQMTLATPVPVEWVGPDGESSELAYGVHRIPWPSSS